MNPNAGNTRLASIDLLRAIAVLLVIGRHSPLLIGYYEYGPWVRMISHAVSNAGWIGVDLFFVLSGFLVAGILFRDPEKLNTGRFLLRRAFKIYPAFYFLIAATLAFDLITGRPLDEWRYVAEVFFLQGYLHHVWPHAWSLAVEEHFYILLPAVLVLLSRRKNPNGLPFSGLSAVVAGVCVSSLILRLAYATSGEAIDSMTFAATHYRLDALSFGVLLAYYTAFEPAKIEIVRSNPRAAMLLSIVLIGPALVIDAHASAFLFTFGYTMLYLGFGILLIVVLDSSRVDVFCLTRPGRLLAYLGRHSYSIYLWHVPVQLGIAAGFSWAGSRDPSIGQTIAYVLASLIAGVLMAKLIEFPALSLRDRLMKRTNLRTAISEAPG